MMDYQVFLKLLVQMDEEDSFSLIQPVEDFSVLKMKMYIGCKPALELQNSDSWLPDVMCNFLLLDD